MVKVSVIIPVYNTEKYLPACLDSVLGQTLKELEVICIDDCSPDRCGEILDGYAAEDSRVKVIHLPENRRQGYGRNRGLEKACGKYLYFLDSDDMIEPYALEELYELSEKEELDAVFFDNRDLHESEEMKKVYNSPFLLRKGHYEDRVYDGPELLDAFIMQQEWTCYPQRIFWRHEMITREGICYPEGSEHEDEYFAFAGILAAKRARYVRKPYFILRVRPDSVMTSPPAPKNFHGYLCNYYHMNRFVALRNIDTVGSRANIAHMKERVNTLYTQLKDRDDLRSVFVSERDKTLFQCYLSWITENEYYRQGADPAVIEAARQAGGVYIYGAGIVGTRFCKMLEQEEEILIRGFLVSKASGNAKVVRNRPVLAVDACEIGKDDLVVVAVSKGLLPEIGAFLDERNIPWIYYRTLQEEEKRGAGSGQ